ncbi:MAG TPA: cytochrome C [Usitatibacter sp.]|nr:cytochrome C [Usitatibacter sp.]
MNVRRLATGAVLFFGALATWAVEPSASFAAPNLSPEGVRALAATCAPCHGPSGRGTGVAEVPPLAGRRDLGVQLRALRERPPATLMAQLSRGLTDSEIEALSRHFASQPAGAR